MDEQAMAAEGAESIETVDLDSVDDGWGDDPAEPEAEPKAEEAADGGGEEPPAEEPAAEPAEPKAEDDPADPMVTLRVNHQDVQVPQSELVALAQKGMDYDRLRAQRDTAPESREAQVLRQYAAQAGMSPEQYIGYLEQNAREADVKRLVDSGMTPEAAGEYLDMKQKAAAAETAERAEQQRAERVNLFVPLVQKYPELQGQKLPPEVYGLIGEGYDPLPAYEHHQQQLKLAEMEQKYAELEGKLAAKTAADKNKDTLPGSAKGLPANTELDPFEKGWNEGG